ncbi:MAG TPA: hypothetical protein PLN21_22195 [Gemmatales bacterium]|nr:hypothetical protein [Gemmatales bacterium]
MTRMLMGFAGVFALLMGNLGCQSMSFTAPWTESAPIGNPTEVVAIWQDGVDVQLDANHGGLPIPGFAGRVVFMQSSNGQSGQSVLVNGPVKILLYDDRPVQGPPEPLETWTIKPEHLPLLVKKDMMGWGYSIWLPWNTYRKDIQNVKMTVEYTDAAGNKLLSVPGSIQIHDAHRGGMPKPQLEQTMISKRPGQP